MNGSFHLPNGTGRLSRPRPPDSGGLCRCFLYYFFCLCKRFKELFPEAFRGVPEGRFSFSGCKGTDIFRNHQIFLQLFYEIGKDFPNTLQTSGHRFLFSIPLGPISKTMLVIIRPAVENNQGTAQASPSVPAFSSHSYSHGGDKCHLSPRKMPHIP